MKRLKIYLIAALYCLAVSCSTSKTIEQDDDFATEATDATVSAEPSGSTADISEFDLDEKAANPEAAPSTDTAAQAPAEKDEFADFENSAAAPPADATAGTQAPTEKDEFAEFDTPATEQLATPVEQTPPPAIAEQAVPIEIQPPVAEVPPVTEPTPVPVEQTPPPVIAETPKPEVPAEEPMAQIGQISYKANRNGGAVTIEADRPLQFTTRLNSATNQLVVEVQNSVVPSRLKRSLNTKDMASSIGSVDIYQKANSKVSRFVVQLRPGAAEPLVQPEGNSLLIIGAANEAYIAKQKEEAARAASAKNSKSHTEFVDLNSDGIMSTESLEKFLMGNQKFYGKKISIETNNLAVTEAIKFIAEESGANLLMDEGIDGNISLKLRQVPWDQALVLILKAKKLGYVRQGSVLRIAKLSDLASEEAEAVKRLEARRGNEPMIVKRFFISYANLEDIQIKIRNFIQATSLAGMAAGAGDNPTDFQGPNGAANPGTAAAMAPAAGGTTPGTSGATPATPGGASAGQGPNTQLLQGDQLARGRVIADTRTSSLIVTDTKDNMDKIEKLIAALDTQPRQITLETRIINATENFSKSLGFNWKSDGSSGASAPNSAALGITTQGQSFPSTIVSSKFTWKSLNIIGNLDAVIQLGEIQDKVKVLNTQRVTVTSGRTISIGAKGVLRKPKTNITSVGNAAVETEGFDKIEYGLSGTIVPQASNENTVSADVDLKQIALTDPTSGNTTENQLGGRVVAQSGQTVAVNASFQSRNATSESGVPGLRDVPVLGMLFKGKTEDLSKSETLVFITMNILEPVTGVFKKAATDISSDPATQAPSQTE